MSIYPHEEMPKTDIIYNHKLFTFTGYIFFKNITSTTILSIPQLFDIKLRDHTPAISVPPVQLPCFVRCFGHAVPMSRHCLAGCHPESRHAIDDGFRKNVIILTPTKVPSPSRKRRDFLAARLRLPPVSRYPQAVEVALPQL